MSIRGVCSLPDPPPPNPIGFSIVRLMKIEENVLRVQDVDIVDGAPLLDVKPYVPQMDARKTEKIGWMEGKVERISQLRDDGRFVERT